MPNQPTDQSLQGNLQFPVWALLNRAHTVGYNKKEKEKKKKGKKKKNKKKNQRERDKAESM